MGLPDELRTDALAQALARAVCGAGCIYLQGPLGAGKSTLARGFLRALGVTGAIRSPTYTLMEPYEVDGRRLLHMDLYRLGDPEEVEYLGVRDEVGEALLLVEWAERGLGFVPEPDLKITLAIEGEGREVMLEAFTERGRLWLQSLPLLTD